MSHIKNVAIIGAAGNLGGPLLENLLKFGQFNFTVLTRPDSKSTYPSSVKTVKVDASSMEDLTSALKGQDALISTVGNDGIAAQIFLVDAAIAAGVSRFIPSEFGSDVSNPKAIALPVFGHKVQIAKYIEEKIKSHPEFTYTPIRNSGLLDWGLAVGFLFSWKERKPAIFDGGDQLFSCTTIPTIAQAVVGVLEHPEESKNRAVYVHDIAISQNKILEIAKKIDPTATWEPVHVSTAALRAQADESLKKGDYSALVKYIFSAIFAEGYGGDLSQKLDNKLFGIKGKTEADVEAILRPLLTGSK
jgi:nucleoside-diphosphate-sugar epimerase